MNIDLMGAIQDAAGTPDGARTLPPRPFVRMATIDPNYVVGSGSQPSVQFTIDDEVSSNTYDILDNNYSPQPNDTVVMILVGHAYAILGQVVPLSEYDTGWVTTGSAITAAGPHSISSFSVRRCGHDTQFLVTVTLGSNVSVGSNGDIANEAIAQLSSAFRPVSGAPNQPVSSGSAGISMDGYVSGSGQILISSVSAGGALSNGDVVSLGGRIFV